jgi:hypothetical protein
LVFKAGMESPLLHKTGRQRSAPDGMRPKCP